LLVSNDVNASIAAEDTFRCRGVNAHLLIYNLARCFSGQIKMSFHPAVIRAL